MASHSTRATVVPKGERDRLKKLCRNISRPALCLKRLGVRSDGKIVWSLRKPWRDGAKSFVFKPYECLAKLAVLVPHPRVSMATATGTFAATWKGILNGRSVQGERMDRAPTCRRSVPRTVGRFRKRGTVNQTSRGVFAQGEFVGDDGAEQAPADER